MSSPGAQLGSAAAVPEDPSTSTSAYVDWYDGNGEVPLTRSDQWGSRVPPHSPQWGEVIKACSGKIVFDVVPCRRCPMTDVGKELRLAWPK